MKTGKIGSFTLAIATVILIIFALRIWLVPSKPKQKMASIPIAMNVESVEGVESQDSTSLIPNFTQFQSVAKKKQAFFDYLRPVVQEQNAKIAEERKLLLEAVALLESNNQVGEPETSRIQQISEKYQYVTKGIDHAALAGLLGRVDTLPEAMVLIQAANETGWGSSRFARQGLNFFGQWCFKKNCGLVPQSRTDGMNHEVAVFETVDASVASYMKNINTNAAYSLLRSMRADLRSQEVEPTAEKLIYGLINYSERKEAYIDELLDMLNHNKQFLVESNAQIPAA